MSSRGLEAEVAAAVRRAARALAAAGAPADVEDLIQEGHLLALEALPTYEPARGSVGAFVWAVVSRCLPRAVARWRSPVSLSDQASRAAPRVELADVDHLADEAETPEQLVAEAEARARAAEVVARALSMMPARAREIAANDIEAPARVVAERLGVSTRRVEVVRKDLAERVRRAVS